MFVGGGSFKTLAIGSGLGSLDPKSTSKKSTFKQIRENQTRKHSLYSSILTGREKTIAVLV